MLIQQVIINRSGLLVDWISCFYGQAIYLPCLASGGRNGQNGSFIQSTGEVNPSVGNVLMARVRSRSANPMPTSNCIKKSNTLQVLSYNLCLNLIELL